MNRYCKYGLAAIILLCVIINIAVYCPVFNKKPVTNNVIYNHSSKEVVKVSVFYESLCSDSKNFIAKQLKHIYEELRDNINLDLVPYGKAQTIEEDGQISFKCQHGPTECLGNKIHACVIDFVTDPGVQLKYVACMISDNMIPYMALEKCGKENGVDYNPIIECSNGHMGSMLLREYGVRTHAVRPKIDFIPTIQFNGSLHVPLSQVLKHFRKEVCDLFQNPPVGCS